MQTNNIRAAVIRTYLLYYNHVHLQELHMQQSALRRLPIGLGRSQVLVPWNPRTKAFANWLFK